MAARVFISFDYDNDATIKEFLVGQAKLPDAPFVFTDASVKYHLSGDWEAKARERIRRADQVIVLCGHRTHTAKGVAIELRIAQELRRPYFLLAGYREGAITKPSTATSRDKIYRWTWGNLKTLIQGER
jgi:hypothetical protein